MVFVIKWFVISFGMDENFIGYMVYVFGLNILFEVLMIVIVVMIIFVEFDKKMIKFLLICLVKWECIFIFKFIIVFLVSLYLYVVYYILLLFFGIVFFGMLVIFELGMFFVNMLKVIGMNWVEVFVMVCFGLLCFFLFWNSVMVVILLFIVLYGVKLFVMIMFFF